MERVIKREQAKIPKIALGKVGVIDGDEVTIRTEAGRDTVTRGKS
jgi:antitoxin component of MazEF toxin-antitoxin module